MARGYVRKPNLTRDTLLTIATIGVLIVATSASPFFLHSIVQRYFKDRHLQKTRSRAKKLRELERRKLIDIQKAEDGKVRVALTKEGSELVHTYQINDLKLKRPLHWDRRWHILIYDIPTSRRQASLTFSRKIKELGLFPLQRSVWISPYECLSEIHLLASAFGIDTHKHIHYFKAVEVPREKEIKTFFGL